MNLYNLTIQYSYCPRVLTKKENFFFLFFLMKIVVSRSYTVHESCKEVSRKFKIRRENREVPFSLVKLSLPNFPKVANILPFVGL